MREVMLVIIEVLVINMVAKKRYSIYFFYFIFFLGGGGRFGKETEDDIISKNEGGQDTLTMNRRLQGKKILVWTQMKYFYGFNHPIQFVFTFSYLREGKKHPEAGTLIF